MGGQLGMERPAVTSLDYQVLALDGSSGALSLLGAEGNTKEDLRLDISGKDASLSSKIQSGLDEGVMVTVTVLSVGGEETVAHASIEGRENEHDGEESLPRAAKHDKSHAIVACGIAKLEEVLALSAASGYFDHSAKLEALTSIQSELTEQWKQADWHGRTIPDRILVTALLLALLRRDFQAEEALWQIFASKATRWLSERQAEWQTDQIDDVSSLVGAALQWLP